MRIRLADVDLTSATFNQPSVITVGRSTRGSAAGSWAEIDILREPEDGGVRSRFADPTTGLADVRPRLLSLQDADVGRLRLSSVDLRPCWFRGAHNVDGMRIDGVTAFGSAPAGLGDLKRLAKEHERRKGPRTPDLSSRAGLRALDAFTLFAETL
jgi:hypothetical protein